MSYFREDSTGGHFLGRGSVLVMFELNNALTADVTLNKVITVEYGVTTPGLGVGHLAVPQLWEHTRSFVSLFHQCSTEAPCTPKLILFYLFCPGGTSISRFQVPYGCYCIAYRLPILCWRARERATSDAGRGRGATR
eukprot:COSAG02_NODE_857_length_16462_cov_4.801381_12_plen_137_part_00